MYNLDPLKVDDKQQSLTKTQKKNIQKQRRKIKRDAFKRLIWYLNYRKGNLFWIIIFSVFSALCLTTGTFFLGYFIDNFLSASFLVGEIKSLVPEYVDNFNISSFVWHFVLLILIFVFQQIFSLISNVLSVRASILSCLIMREDAYKAIMKMPVSFFDSVKTGELMSILTSDIDNINNGMTGSLNTIIITFTTIISSFGFMFYYSAYLTLITLFLMPIMLCFVFVVLKKANPQFRKQQSRVASLNGFIEENLAAHHLIRSLDFTKQIEDEFIIRNNKLYSSSLKANLYIGLMWPLGNAVINILQLIIVVIASAFTVANIGTGSNSNFTPGVIITFVLYIRVMANSIVRVFENLSSIQMALVSAVRVMNLATFKPLVDETKLRSINYTKGNVSFMNVDFSYTNDVNNLQLKNASFMAKKGQVFAIVGPTGAGKTTIINLLSKFYLPLSGNIEIDGNNSRDINEQSWRQQISIVLQDTFLFKTTIMQNLRYANPNATDDEIKEAAKISHADEFIMRLGNGYEEIIEEGGANLSQGERQLIAITRAIIANRNILILDEATSNIDTRTEKIIQKAMMKLMKGKTSFIIAHRLSTILSADKILVVNNGKIVESGTHKELLAKKGLYEKMYNSSFRED
ncbi:ABC transporter ATP-binding protein [Mycoplasma sp. 2575]